MDRRDTEHRLLVERYLQGGLTPDEEVSFEEALLADPQLLDDVLVAEQLHRGLRLHSRAQPGSRRRSVQVFGSPWYAAAATMLLALSVMLSGVLYVQNRGLREQSGSMAASAVTRLLPLVTVRGDADVNVVDRPEADELVVFLVDAGFTDYDEYRAVVFRVGDGEAVTVREASGLIRTDDDWLPVSVPGSLLTEGDYEIVIEGRMSDWPTGREAEQISRTPLRIVNPV